MAAEDPTPSRRPPRSIAIGSLASSVVDGDLSSSKPVFSPLLKSPLPLRERARETGKWVGGLHGYAR
jgi:hypothetical protein